MKIKSPLIKHLEVQEEIVHLASRSRVPVQVHPATGNHYADAVQWAATLSAVLAQRLPRGWEAEAKPYFLMTNGRFITECTPSQFNARAAAYRKRGFVKILGYKLNISAHCENVFTGRSWLSFETLPVIVDTAFTLEGVCFRCWTEVEKMPVLHCGCCARSETCPRCGLDLEVRS